jgi:hypothetical protein
MAAGKKPPPENSANCPRTQSLCGFAGVLPLAVVPAREPPPPRTAAPAPQSAPRAPAAPQSAPRAPDAPQSAPRAPDAPQSASRAPAAPQSAPRAPDAPQSAPRAPDAPQSAPRGQVSCPSPAVPSRSGRSSRAGDPHCRVVVEPPERPPPFHTACHSQVPGFLRSNRAENAGRSWQHRTGTISRPTQAWLKTSCPS